MIHNTFCLLTSALWSLTSQILVFLCGYVGCSLAARSAYSGTMALMVKQALMSLWEGHFTHFAYCLCSNVMREWLAASLLSACFRAAVATIITYSEYGVSKTNALCFFLKVAASLIILDSCSK